MNALSFYQIPHAVMMLIYISEYERAYISIDSSGGKSSYLVNEQSPVAGS